MVQTYRCNFKLRRRGQAALDHNRCELKTEDYDTNEDFCLAVASELLDILQTDQEYLSDQEDSE